VNNDLIQQLESASTMLPRQQRILCDYIRGNLLEASMLTIPQMAENAGIATATVVRTVQSLGYPSFKSFKAELKRTALFNSGDSYTAFVKAHSNHTGQHDVAESNLLSVIKQCADAARGMENPDFIRQIVHVVDLLYHAKHIYTLALRSTEPTATGFRALLHNPAIPVTQLHNKGEMLFDYLLQITKQDVLLVWASHPVTKKTSEVVRICHDRGIPIIIITSTPEAPICQYATVLINALQYAGPDTSYSLASTPLYLTAELLAVELARRYGVASAFSEAELLDKFVKEYDLDLWDN